MTLDKDLIKKIDSIIGRGFIDVAEDYTEEMEKSFDDEEIRKLLMILMINSEITAYQIAKLLEKRCSGNVEIQRE